MGRYADIDPASFLSLRVPIFYGGRERGQIYLGGQIFGKDVESTFQRIRDEIPLQCVDSGKPCIDLDSFTVGDLRAEAVAYSARSTAWMDPNLPCGINPIRAASDLDRTIGILQMISLYAHDREIRERANESLRTYGLISDMAVAVCAVHQKNYAWARMLLENGLKTIGTDGDLPEEFLSTYHTDAASQSVAIAAALQDAIKSGRGGKALPRTLSERLNYLLENVNIRERRDPDQHRDIIPTAGPAPSSYKAKLADAVESERYEDAARLRDRMARVRKTLGTGFPHTRPFIRWAGEETLLGVVPSGRKFKSGDDKLEIYKGRETTSGSLEVAVHDPRNLPPLFQHKGQETSPRGFGIVPQPSLQAQIRQVPGRSEDGRRAKNLPRKGLFPLRICGRMINRDWISVTAALPFFPGAAVGMPAASPSGTHPASP